ncbi:DUF4349 domain-containing protein [Nocardioides piscis]|uniref:DUF4349 domain-containing protein n=1 Tax=Nocardioides piscis TaxID=2714938 RepID=A0A6G7YBN2_9ACTN|nr:DUF4349 domain-containing protein [Nocardioides piscis]QIK74314.1 DUF4349 domain-containing protein [Nocardioides piscis]
MQTSSRLHPRGGRRARLVVALTMTAALLGAVAACSSSDSGDSAEGDAGGSGLSSLEAPQEGHAESGDSEGSGDAGKSADRDAALDDGSDSTASLRAPASERAVISKGTVSLVSDDVAKARNDVQRIVDAQHGTVAEENTETDDKGVATYARLVVRVPADSFAVTMASLEKAAELRSAGLTSEDVTTEVIDTGVRVRAQESSLRRVEQLLAEADSLKDIIWIESQLTRRQAELDSLKSQQAWLADQTSDSTITVDIERRYVPEEDEETDEDAGFLSGFKSGLKALGAFAEGLGTVVGAVLPFAMVLAVIGVPTWLLVRHARRRQGRPGGSAAEREVDVHAG